MKILVCVKQVAAPGSGVTIRGAGVEVYARGLRPYVMNRFDEFAVEESILIKERVAGAVVDVVSVGPARAVETIRRALGMGADNGLHVVTEPGARLGPHEVAACIAEVARGKSLSAVEKMDSSRVARTNSVCACCDGTHDTDSAPPNEFWGGTPSKKSGYSTVGYDLILAGVMSEDEANCAVGQMTAEMLGLPCATFVAALEVDAAEGVARAERELGGGVRECVEVSLPAAVTIQAGINRPRYPALSKVMKAEKSEMEVFSAADLLAGARRRTRTVGARYPEKRKGALVIDGTRTEKAARLLEILREKHFV